MPPQAVSGVRETLETNIRMSNGIPSPGEVPTSAPFSQLAGGRGRRVGRRDGGVGERHETGREITSPLKVGGHWPIKELSGQHKAQFSFLGRRTLDLESDGSGFKSQLSRSLAV